MTEPNLQSGSDRSLAAANIFKPTSNIIVNLQGDAPFTDPNHIKALLTCLKNTKADIATPAVQLSWEHLDLLRLSKKKSPFSGTTVIENNDHAIWFSKSILPAIRNETNLRSTSSLSPVLRHIGLYGFQRLALEQYTAIPQSNYEKFEGLEQLRAIQAGMSIRLIKVKPPRIFSSGIDTAEDLAQAEDQIEKFGDPFTS